jgi:hypothetical protein
MAGVELSRRDVTKVLRPREAAGPLCRKEFYALLRRRDTAPMANIPIAVST